MGSHYDEQGVMRSNIAFILLQRSTEVAARCALGDGLTREEVADSLESLADAIRTENVAEDMSPISVPME